MPNDSSRTSLELDRNPAHQGRSPQAADLQGQCSSETLPLEWPTILVAVVCYAGWLVVLAGYEVIGPWLTGVLLTLLLTLHSSLQHEIIHGHPFRSRRANTMLGCVPLGLLIPFERFRDLHLMHHRDHLLTDPYDDPESNYVCPADWGQMALPVRCVLRFNNTLLGRMMVGPAISLARFYRQDFVDLWTGQTGLRRTYALHGIGLIGVGATVLAISSIPWWLYLVSAYVAMSVLKIRTFLEHRANETVAHRTVIVEDRGLLSLLFLNNNFHAVHHARPGLPWYQLPRHYRAHRSRFVSGNDGYVYASYATVIFRYLLRIKDPVPHPLLPKDR